MWITIGLTVCALLALVTWAIVYGGSMNDPDRYEEGNYDRHKTKESKLSDKDKEV